MGAATLGFGHGHGRAHAVDPGLVGGGRDHAPVVVDEPPHLLGEDTAPNPSEALLAALGACLIIGRTISTPIQPLVTLGSMPLTAYVGHLIMLNIPVLKHDSWTTLLIQFVVLLVFANLWRVWFSKGPLEAVLGLFTGAVKNWTQPPHTPARALP